MKIIIITDMSLNYSTVICNDFVKKMIDEIHKEIIEDLKKLWKQL